MATSEKHKDLLEKLQESEKIIAKHQAVEASLRLSEQRFRAAASSTVDLIWEADMEKKTLLWFGDIDGFLGYSPGEFPHTVKAWSSRIHPDDRSRVITKVNRILETGEEYYEEYYIKCKDGAYRYWEDRGRFVEFADGKYYKWVGAITDITQRKLAEQELRQAELRYRIVAEYNYDWEYWENPDGSMNYISPSCKRITGYEAKEFMDRSSLVGEIVLPEDKGVWKNHHHNTPKNIDPHRIQFRIRQRDGKIRWIEHGCQPIRDNSGKFLGFRASNRDITDRKMAEEALQRALSEIKILKEQLEAENVYLREEMEVKYQHEDIIGKSGKIKQVLLEIEQVAGTESTVLLLGETGTGKELIARTIHNLSPRKSRALVKVNCAALPSTLVENELFGSEKGAYTGALRKRTGRFESANGSTIFLDEISELPLELQAKLLRVLQDGRFERLGSSKTIGVDVRVIAATNKDLAKAVKNGQFREDLYYRLNVFPITIPPLRERIEDIPLLVWAFVNEFGVIMGKTIEQIP